MSEELRNQLNEILSKSKAVSKDIITEEQELSLIDKFLDESINNVYDKVFKPFSIRENKGKKNE